MEAVRDTSQQLRERALQAQDMTVAYVKDEPIKAMLIAAATGAAADGHGQHARPLARLRHPRHRGSRKIMIHPLLRLAATEPHLLGDHVEAYASLVGDEVGKISTSVITRVVLYVAALCMVAVGLVLVGVALLFCVAVPPSDYPGPWAMFVVPLAPFVIAVGCIVFARSKPTEKAFDTIKKQLNADMAMLREVSASMSTAVSSQPGTTPRGRPSNPAAAFGQPRTGADPSP